MNLHGTQAHAKEKFNLPTTARLALRFRHDEHFQTWAQVAQWAGLNSGAAAWNIAHEKQPVPPGLLRRLFPRTRKPRPGWLLDVPEAELRRAFTERQEMSG